MIPTQLTFTVREGTGTVYTAKLTDDAKHYCITSDDVICHYSVKETFGFLREGQWISPSISF